MLERLNRINPQILYAILLVSMVVPLVRPLGLPLRTPKETVAVYEMLDSLSEGAAIAVSMDTGAGGYDEMGPGTIAVLNHAAKKGLRVIGVSVWVTGPSLLEDAFANSMMSEKEYGKDYINLGYVPGGETGMAIMGRSIEEAYPTDFHNNPVAGAPVLDGVKNLRDIELLIIVAAGTPGIPEWIRQVGDPLQVPIATVLLAGLVADYTPYIQSRQLLGMVPGLRGAAGYEKLVDVLGRGAAGIDAQSAAHVVILLLVVLGNILHFSTKDRPTGKGGEA